MEYCARGIEGFVGKSEVLFLLSANKPIELMVSGGRVYVSTRAFRH